MIYSLNEIDVHCKKAARGAGFEWGYAEEIGKAARWLAAYNLPGAHLLSQFLTEKENQATASCPIHTGACLADAACIKDGTELKFEQISFPLLLLPYLARLADQAKLGFEYHYDNTQFSYVDGKLKCNSTKNIECKLAKPVNCHFITDNLDGENARVIGQDINDTDWKRLNHYACKTYVPATEQSRLGAGPSE